MTNKQYYFRFEGKIQRADYFVSGIILPMLLLFIGLLTIGSEDASTLLKEIFSFTLFILALWINIAISIKRVNDLNMPIWIFWLTFVPVIGFIPFLILIFKKGLK